ncbi:MAG: glutaredoxin family protein [Gallionella sp.]|nr:glutaredoxin family protein [Gallionella sp.]
MSRFVILLGLLLLAPAGAEEVYRWVDANGKVHYGDKPPAQAARVDTLKLGDTPAPPELPYETRRAQQNFPVTLYIGDSCGEFCAKARELLTRRGIPFSEKRLITQQEIDAFKAAAGSDGIPALSVGKMYLNGFQSERWHGELDVAGYPKSAPYRGRTALPVPSAASEVAPAAPAIP